MDLGLLLLVSAVAALPFGVRKAATFFTGRSAFAVARFDVDQHAGILIALVDAAIDLFGKCMRVID